MNIEISVTHTLSPDVMDLIAKALNGHSESYPKKIKKIETKLVEAAKPVQEPEAETSPVQVKEKPVRISLEEVSAKALTLANGGKRDEVKNLLKEFKATRVSYLKEEQFADFLTALNEM